MLVQGIGMAESDIEIFAHKGVYCKVERADGAIGFSYSTLRYCLFSLFFITVFVVGPFAFLVSGIALFSGPALSRPGAVAFNLKWLILCVIGSVSLLFATGLIVKLVVRASRIKRVVALHRGMVRLESPGSAFEYSLDGMLISIVKVQIEKMGQSVCLVLLRGAAGVVPVFQHRSQEACETVVSEIMEFVPGLVRDEAIGRHESQRLIFPVSEIEWAE